MLNTIKLILPLCLCSCNDTNLQPHHTSFNRSAEFQQEINELISQDAENKRWARIYLHEIDQAMLHDDMISYVFYIKQYEETPIEIVPEYLRTEPGYVGPPSDLELFFRLRWFEQACELYKQLHKHNETPVIR